MLASSGNPILDKNLECIERYNPDLVEKILSITSLTNRIEVTETKLQEPNLTYNALPLHSINGAEEEAKKIFNNIPNSKTSRHIIFGMGLGYLFKECCERSFGKVFLYESNLEILRVTLEIVDFSKELSQPNVFVASDMEFLKVLYFTYKAYQINYSLLSLNSYKNFIYNKEFEEMIRQVGTIAGTITVNYNVLKLEEFSSIKMVLENLPKTIKGVPLAECADFYKDKAALIISAGPTLDENLEIIKQNRDKVIIFCVGQAFKALKKHGIKPDFVNIADQKDLSGQLLGCDLSDVNLVIEPFCHKAFFNLNVQQLFLFPTISRNANVFWSHLTQTDLSPYFSGGTVSYEALESAKILGCSKIMLVGQDLAYINNRCYAQGSAYSGLTFNVDSKSGEVEFENSATEIDSFKSVIQNENEVERAEKLKKQKVIGTKNFLFYVKGINGNMLPSQTGYALFINNFTDFANNNKHLDLINTSMQGAQINGFKNIPLDEALQGVQIIDKKLTKVDFKFDEKKVLSQLKVELLHLKTILSSFPKAFEIISTYERELKINKRMTKSSINHIQELLNIYKRIFRKQNCLFNAISLKEDIELIYKINEKEDYDVNTAKEIYNLLKDYFYNSEKKALQVIEKIELQSKILEEKIEKNESINSKS